MTWKPHYEHSLEQHKLNSFFAFGKRSVGSGCTCVRCTFFLILNLLFRLCSWNSAYFSLLLLINTWNFFKIFDKTTISSTLCCFQNKTAQTIETIFFFNSAFQFLSNGWKAMFKAEDPDDRKRQGGIQGCGVERKISDFDLSKISDSDFPKFLTPTPAFQKFPTPTPHSDSLT